MFFRCNLSSTYSNNIDYKYYFKFFSKFFFKKNFLTCYFLPKYIKKFTPLFFFKLRVVRINKHYTILSKIFLKKFPYNRYYFYNILCKNKCVLYKKPYTYIKNFSFNHHKLMLYLT